MRIRTRYQPSGSFFGGSFPRLGAMVMLLGVLYLLMGRARDPQTWRWLESEESDRQVSIVAAENPLPTPDLAETTAKTVTPPPDQDQEELAEAREQFEAISDRSIQLAREEMPAYWRLFRWSESQTFEELRQRAAKGAVLNQFMQSPTNQRGKLTALTLNVRRVLAYDAPLNSAGVDKVYEVWGFTDESQGWLYVGVTAHVPPGMPLGPRVNERARFVGYFLKLQGYQPGGAKPNDKPLAAPLFVGQLDWQPSPLAQAETSNNQWMYWVAALLIAGMAAHLTALLWRRTPTLASSASAPEKSVNPEEWQALGDEPSALDLGIETTPRAKLRITTPPVSE